MLPAPGRASAGASVLRGAIVAGDLNDYKNGSAQFSDSGVDLRAAAPAAVVFFAVRGSAEIARRATSDFDGDEEKGVVNISAARQKTTNWEWVRRLTWRQSPRRVLRAL